MKATLNHIFAAFVLLLSFAAPVAAGPFEDAAAAYSRRDYATALQLIRPLADQGVAEAQHNLALMFYNGQGTAQNYTEAVKWYRLAADQGYARAQNNLGGMYRDGDGVPQNYAEAVRWYRLAADQGNALAQLNLGIRYYNGQGVPRDYVRAHLWFSLSAAQGNQEAVKNRGMAAGLMTPAQIAEAQKLARAWKPTTQPHR